MYINGIYFPIENDEDAELIREETKGKTITDTLIVLGYWLDASGLPYPSEELPPVVEGQNG